MNNDFWSQVRWFANEIHLWLFIGKLPHLLPKNSIHSNSFIILYLIVA